MAALLDRLLTADHKFCEYLSENLSVVELAWFDRGSWDI